MQSFLSISLLLLVIFQVLSPSDGFLLHPSTVRSQSQGSRRHGHGSPLFASASNEPVSVSVLNSFRSAARMGDAPKLMKLLEEYKDQPEILTDPTGDMMGLTALHWAVACGQVTRVEAVRVLLEAGADVEAENKAGNSALKYACATGKIECAELLLQYGAKITAGSNKNKQTVLHAAIIKGDADLSSLLLDKGGLEVLNASDINGNTALHLARLFGKEECEKLLVSRGADLNLKNEKGEIPYEVEKCEITNFSYE